MHIDLSGKVAVVTGAAQGIGAETARQLAACGACVVVADIQDEKGQAVVADINAAAGQVASPGAAGGAAHPGQAAATGEPSPGRALYVHADVSQEADIQAMIQAAVEHFGRLDILVNNAHFEVHGSATELTVDDWDRSYAVLVRALFLGAKHAVPHLRRAGGGSIINIASVLGRHPTERYATYTSAKAAVPQLTRQLALDYGPDGIRVNTITPGHINTNPVYAHSPRRDSLVAQLVPLRREGVPRDIAAAICFLVSEHASYITGADLVIDGGLTVPFGPVLVDRARRLWQEERKAGGGG